MAHKPIIELGQSIIFRINMIHEVSLSVFYDTRDEKTNNALRRSALLFGNDTSEFEGKVSNVALHSLSQPGIIEIDNKFIKLSIFNPNLTKGINLAYDTLFVGHTDTISYNENSEIKEIKGICQIDNSSSDNFLLQFNISSIYNQPLDSSSNIYIEVLSAKYGDAKTYGLSDFKNYYLENLILLNR